MTDAAKAPLPSEEEVNEAFAGESFFGQAPPSLVASVLILLFPQRC